MAALAMPALECVSATLEDVYIERTGANGLSGEYNATRVMSMASPT